MMARDFAATGDSMPNIKPRPRSNQDAFNNVWQHFIVEGQPRGVRPVRPDESPVIGEYDRCLYRGGEGQMCAIGCQLPADLSLSELGNSASLVRLWHACSAVRAQFTHVDLGLLDALQQAHDRRTSADVAQFAAELRVVARRFHLTVPTTPSDGPLHGEDVTNG
jgi:hypothetical protein